MRARRAPIEGERAFATLLLIIRFLNFLESAGNFGKPGGRLRQVLLGRFSDSFGGISAYNIDDFLYSFFNVFGLPR